MPILCRFKTARVGYCVMALLITMLIPGCGSQGPALVPVSGTVTLDGAPLPGATISFMPSEGEIGISSVATTDENGKFVLMATSGEEGAIVTTHEVRISTLKIDESDGEMKTISEEKVPKQYNSETGLSFTVPAEGTSSADFALTSDE